MSKIDDGGPAFPRSTVRVEGTLGMFSESAQHGMTLRDYFAGQALAGIAASCNNLVSPREWDWQTISQAAHIAADAMLAARKKEV